MLEALYLSFIEADIAVYDSPNSTVCLNVDWISGIEFNNKLGFVLPLENDWDT